MAINDLDVNQASTILNAAVAQATGGAAATLDTKDFVTVATTALKVGYDKLQTGLSQVLSRTIFAARPYSRRFKILEADALRYGNHVRKVNYLDKALVPDPAYGLTTGSSVDMYVVNKPEVIQTNFYGYNTFDYYFTVYKEQLNMALRGPEEWAGWLGGLMQHAQNQMEQAHEESGRMTVLNLIGGSSTTFKLITQYNALTGQSLTISTIFDPANFPDFARFVFATLATYSRALQARGYLYHTNLTAGNIMRATPVEDQRLIMHAFFMDMVRSMVMSTTFHDELLKLIPNEEIAYWQTPNDIFEINVDASYLKADGTIGNMTFSADRTAPVVAVMFDKDAAGYTTMGQSYDVTPYNVAGKYWNHGWSFQDRYWNDFTENSVVFTLD